MNSSINRFSLNMHSAQSQISIPVLLGDTGRTFRISLSDGGNPYIIVDGCLAKLSIKRPTGTRLEEFCAIEYNTTIVYNFDQNENTCAVEGIHECDVTLYGLDGAVLTTAMFTMVVSERVITSDDIIVTDEDLTAVDAMLKAEASRQVAENNRVEAEVERSEAEAERVANEEERKENAMLFKESVEQAVEAKTASKAYAESAKASETNAKASEANATNASNVATSQAQSAIESASASASSATVAKGYMEVAKGIAADSTNMDARISRNDKRITNLEQGLTPDPFETDNSMAYQKDVPANALPYAEIAKVGGMTYKDGNTLRSAPVTEVKSVGVNLFDISKLSGMDSLVLSGDKINVTTASNNSGVTSASRIKDVAPQLKVGDIVTLTAITTGSDKYIYLEDALMPWYYGTSKTITEVMLNSRITFYASGVSTSATISDIMLNKGSTALPYTPYVEHTLPIPEAVRPANGINGNVYDYIEWAEDGSQKQGVRCGVADLGTLAWQVESYYAYSLSLNPAAKHGGELLYTNLPTGIRMSGIDTAQAIVVSFDEGRYDAETFKAAMSGVMLVYELAEPIVTDISDLITADNLIGVEGNGTITFENEYGYAVPSEVTYQLKGVTA